MNFANFNWFDFLLVIVILFSLVVGLIRGLLREIIALLTWVAAFFVAILFTDNLSVYFNQFFKTEYLSNIVSFIVLFLVVLVIGGLINYIVANLIQGPGITIADRLFGGIFGFVRGLLISILVVFVVSNTALQNQDWFVKSQMTGQLQVVSSWMKEQITVVTKKAKTAKDATVKVVNDTASGSIPVETDD